MVVGFASGILLIIAVLFGLNYFVDRQSPEDSQVGLAAPGQENAAAVSTDQGDAPEDTEALPNAEDDADSVAADLAPDATPDSAPISTEQKPEVATFRLLPDGEMLIAGRTIPGWETSVRLDADVISTFQSEDNGDFVLFLTLDPSAEPRVLSLSARSPETGEDILSSADIIIAPLPETEAVAADETAEQSTDLMVSPDAEAAQDLGPDVALAEAQEDDGIAPRQDKADQDKAGQEETGQDETGQDETGQDEIAQDLIAQEETGPDAEDVASFAQDGGDTPSDAMPDQAAANTSVILSDEEGISLLPSGSDPSADDGSPLVMSEVALDTITYSETGDVELTGRAVGDGFVRVYVDNAPVITSPIEEGGQWRSSLPTLDSGIYTLRIDEVAADGTVLSRVETPFQREDTQVLADALEPGRTVQAITVQPGFTLWGISRERYGDGFAYVRIFEANRDLIRDPDLIYPGQVFSLPQ
ncbi:MAG: peptidoglycan-binding protein [Pseudomonadota bacterium]